MQVWASILLVALRIGAALLERADRAAYNDFRRYLGTDTLGVLGSQFGKDGLDTVHASSDKSENRGA